MSSESIYMSPPCSCAVCHEHFSSAAIHSHFIRKHTTLSKRQTDKGTKKFLLYCSCIICKKEMVIQNLERHYNSHFVTEQDRQKICPKCNSFHTKPGTFCSRKCANSRIHTSETKNKISSSLNGKQNKYKNTKRLPLYTKVSQCASCGKWFRGNIKSCSTECKNKLISLGGRKGSARRVKRSKDEVSLYDLCSNYFNHVSHNEPIFNGWDADIIIHDTKTAILWNGPWHYREMVGLKHSLKQVQNRDKIKTKEIESMGWKVMVFEDRSYTPESAFSYIMNTQ